jgi:hypothetical protein
MADPTFVNAPAQTVKKKFSISGSIPPDAGGGIPPAQAVPQSDLTQQPVPASITPEQIAQMFQPLLEQAQAEQPPLSRPVPAEISPIGAFLGTLAGNLASTFAQNPAHAQQAQRFLAEDAEKRRTIEEQNYAAGLLFDKEKHNRLISLRGKILEAQVGRAIESGDLEAASVATQNLTKFQEGLRREAAATAQKNEERSIRVTGEEARKTQAARFKLEAEKGRDAKTKPLTSKEYITGINDINKNKNIKDRSFFEGVGAWAHSLVGGIPEPTDRQTALETVYVTGLLGGEPQVRPTAWRSLRLSIRRRLGLPTTEKLNPVQRQRFETELTRYGLELGGLEP